MSTPLSLRLLPLTLMLTACWTLPEEVRLTGTVLDEYRGTAIEGVAIDVSDPLGDAYGQGSTAADGSFDVAVPASSAFFVTVDSTDGYLPTSFTGLAGSEDVAAEEGTLYLRSEDELAALRAEFSACPDVDTEGPVIEGVVRPYLDVAQDTEELPTITTAWITVYDVNDDAWSACYLDDDGNSLPDGEQTGNTGRFAIFGVPTGPLTVDVSYAVTDELTMTSYYLVLAPEGGMVPMYPAWVELP